jgi:two-component system, sensor histidine kinase and response regulator
MPGLNGFDTCRKIRELPTGVDTAIVFLTALGDVSSYAQAVASGADDFLTKPINRTELVLRVQSLLWIRRLTEDLRKNYDMIAQQRDALLRAQELREQMASLIVHDLKSPLATILSNTRFGLRKEVPPDVAEALRDVRDSAEGMQRLVMNLLDVSRSEDGALVPHIERFDLSQLARDIVAQLSRRAAERQQSIEAPTGSLSVTSDCALIRRLLENLLDNCLKYAHTGSQISVELEATPDGLMLRVRDNGPGIPADQRHKVFDKYIQLGQQISGSRGLGLTFCRVAVEALGGSIWVEENRPHGSCFCVNLPVDGERTFANPEGTADPA